MGRNLMAGAADDYDHVSTLHIGHKPRHICCGLGGFWAVPATLNLVDLNKQEYLVGLA